MERSLLLSILLICGLSIPSLSYAEAGSFLLSEKDTKLIINEIQKEVSRVGGTIDIFKYSSQEQAALTLLRSSARDIVLRFLPAFVATETVKVVLHLVSSLDKVSEVTIKDILDEIEKQTVGKAIEIGNTWLLQNEVKTGSGAIEHPKSGGSFQYLLIYKSTTESRADIIFEFYSPDQIDSPSFKGSIGTFSGSLGDSAYMGKVDPFIIHIETKVTKSGLGWTVDSSADTKITVEFPDTVPVLKLSKELPYPFEEQKIKLLNYLNTARRIFDFLQSVGSEALGKTADFAHKAKETVKSVIIHTSQLLAKSGALLIDPFSKESQQIAFIESQLDLVKESLDAKEAEVKLNLIKDEAILGLAKAENTEPVENLIGLSFPQEQAFVPLDQTQPDSVKDSQSQAPDPTELSQTKDATTKSDLVAEDEAKLNQVKDCEADPWQATALGDVVINEVAWMGTPQSANDEWIELHSKSGISVSLNGWRLRDKGNHINIVFDSSHALAPNGFFLLERTNDTTVPNFTADLIYTGALSNSDEALYLFDQNCVLRDKVAASPGWSAGDNVSKKSMERNNHNLEWYTYDGQGFGSPRQTNGRDMLTDYRPLVNVSFQAGISGGGPPAPQSQNSNACEPNSIDVNTASAQDLEKLQGIGPVLAQSIIDERAVAPFSSLDDLARVSGIAEGKVSSIKEQGCAYVNLPEPEPEPEPLPPPPAIDTTAPAAITDLFASSPTTSSVQLSWTAPGDDGSTGTAARYDVRYSTASITEDNLNSATQVTGEPTPSVAGTIESMTVAGLSAGTTYYFALQSSDEVPNVSALSNVSSLATTVLPPPPQDTTAPAVTFGALSSLQNNISFSLDWTATDSGGEASPSGVQSIFIEYTVTPSAAGVFAQYDNNGVWTDWQTGSMGKITLGDQTTFLSIRAQDGVSYAFQISASDAAGNVSAASSASTNVALSKTVVINEVAWAGTKAQSTDEWLELFNTTSSSVDLAGWKLTSSDSSGPELTLAGTIAAGGFYLIERTDDQATTATAQLTASFGNGLSNTACETLYLYNAENVVVDQTACASDGAWPAGTASPDYISMERIISMTEGSNVSNWASNNRIKYNNKDVGNNWINGTPGQTNSTATSPTTITELRFDEFSSLVLTALGSPYVTTAGIISITVPAGKTLIIEPGVTVKFADSRGKLTVQGTLKAQGTQASGITLTVTDGGSIWCGIKITSTSTDSQLDYVTIDKAQSIGSSYCNENVNYAMYVDSSIVAINNSIIQTGSYHRKLYLKNSNSAINAVTISGATLNTGSVGIYIDGGSPAISNSTISNNSIGILVNSLSNNPTIQNNTFTGNTYAVKLSSASAALSGNIASGNTYNGIFFGGAVSNNMTWQADAIPYIVNKFTVNAGATLTIQAGAVIKFVNSPYTDSAITVQGALITQGTETNPVVFTAAADNTVGGSNSYTGGGIKTSWERIYIASGSTGSQLTYTTLKYGGNTYYEAALYVQQSDVQLSNVTILNSAYSGIYSHSGTITGSDVTLSNNTYGFHIQTGDCPALSNVTITGTLLHPSSSACSF